jgi:hypothetical protein
MNFQQKLKMPKKRSRKRESVILYKNGYIAWELGLSFRHYKNFGQLLLEYE